jgi:hypothetical protein
LFLFASDAGREKVGATPGGFTKSYCIMVSGVQMNVMAYEKDGEKFIRTRQNKSHVDSLLSLDPC